MRERIYNRKKNMVKVEIKERKKYVKYEEKEEKKIMKKDFDGNEEKEEIRGKMKRVYEGIRNEEIEYGMKEKMREKIVKMMERDVDIKESI